MEDVVERMRRDITIENIKGDAFRVSYVNQDPRTGDEGGRQAVAARSWTRCMTDRASQAQTTTDFLRRSSRTPKRRLEDQEKKLAEYKMAHAGELPTERDANLQVLRTRRCSCRRWRSR